MKKDVFLMIPCDLTNYIEEINIVENEIGNYLINEVKKNNEYEFKSDFIKNLDRSVLGTHKLSSDLINGFEEAIITVTKHHKTNNGMICMYIPLAKNDPTVIVQSLISGLLNIELQNGKVVKLSDYMTDKNIAVSGNAKSLIFVDEELSQNDIIKILACESDPVAEIIGDKLVESSKINIAQYNSAKVYCGENVLLEIQKVFLEDIKKRISNEAIEVFFMELLLLQDAAISRICNRIIEEMEIETRNPIRKNNIQVLDELSCETAQAILFLDFNCFIYPTVRSAAEKISKNFGLDKLIEKYYKYKNVLETLINIHDARVDEVENQNMNILLLVLTLTQVVSVLVDLFSFIFENKVGVVSVLSFLSSISVCFILLFVFNLLRRRKLKRYKDRFAKKKLSDI